MLLKGTKAQRDALTSMSEGDEFVVNAGVGAGEQHKYLGATAGWVTTHDASGAARVAVDTLPAHQVTQNIYSGTAVGSMITENLDTFTYFQFQVIGASALEDVSVGISLDGVNFILIPVINMATGAEISAGIFIEAAGMFRYGNEPTVTSLRDAPVGMGVKSIRITRETAAAAAQVDVIMRAC